MKRILTALVCLCLLVGCQTKPNVKSEFLEKANFDNIQTYAFTLELSGKNMPAQIGPNSIKAMRSAIEERFATLGYKQVKTPQDADIVVNIRADVLRIENNPHWRLGFGFRRDRAFYAAYDPDIDNRDERTLLIDIYRNTENAPELIWRGYTTKYFFIRSKSDPKEVKSHITEIMNHFPPNPSDIEN